MGQIIIRNLDDAVLTKIKNRAKSNKRSTEAEVRNILSEAAVPVPQRKSLVSLIGLGRPGRTQAEIDKYLKALRDEWDH
jgi:plasmid stability protein